ncbi:MAG: bifunctional 3,4-dihydroxy-2-butanone-4-phosphate synthase/GTP cyclohydrolase II [Bacteroidales bacterium]|nr:bifunctional 3,4-dihydroxy-2-butanone-4-phosphate synthase/GTP cyclohydrolase II [Bacteroidales bacterium]
MKEQDENQYRLDTIEDALREFQNGNFVIVVDDEDRENEGDFIIAAEKVTPEKVNFMIRNGRGELCAPISEDRCAELELQMQVANNTSLHETPFTITVDLIGSGCTTGVSMYDRAMTIRALANPETKPSDLARPGHIHPLRARNRGVLRRAGHTEAAVDLARLAGLYPAAALIEIINEDGTMARLPQLMEIAKQFDLKIISIKDLIAYRLKQESIVEKGVEVDLPTKYGRFRLIPFRQKSNGLEHVALIKGTWEKDEPILVRMHSSCATGDIFGSMRCECGEQLHKAMETIDKEGKGVVVYLSQEGRGIGLMNKIAAYKLQEEGLDTVDANLRLGFAADERDYGVGATILHEMGVSKIRLMTNNPKKRVGLEGYGLKIVENVPIEIPVNQFNEYYMQTKKEKMGHVLHLCGKKQ